MPILRVYFRRLLGRKSLVLVQTVLLNRRHNRVNPILHHVVYMKRDISNTFLAKVIKLKKKWVQKIPLYRDVCCIEVLQISILDQLMIFILILSVGRPFLRDTLEYPVDRKF